MKSVVASEVKNNTLNGTLIFSINFSAPFESDLVDEVTSDMNLDIVNLLNTINNQGIQQFDIENKRYEVQDN